MSVSSLAAQQQQPTLLGGDNEELSELEKKEKQEFLMFTRVLIR
jgi:hypothetical protein